MGRTNDAEMTPEEKAELFDEIEETERARRVARDEMERTKEAAKIAKDAHQALTDKLMGLVGANMEEYPLFAGEEDGDSDAYGDDQPAAEVPSGNPVESAVKTLVAGAERLVKQKGVESVTLSSGGKTVMLASKDNSKPARTDWQTMGLCAAAFSDTEERLLEEGGISSLGQLKECVDLKTAIPGVHGNYRARIEGKLRKYLEEIGATA